MSNVEVRTGKPGYGKRGMNLWVVMCMVAVLAATSCVSTFQAYSGPKRPQSEIGILYINSDHLFIHSIDGETGEVSKGFLERLWSGSGRIPPDCRKILLPPGHHVVEVEYSSSWNCWPSTYTTYSKIPWKVEVEVQAGSRFDLVIDENNLERGPYVVLRLRFR
jgi:hypothetical protein